MTVWTEQQGGEFWECGNCKLAWFFDTGTPEENELGYCPKCGQAVTEFIHTEEQGEDQ